MSNKNLTILSVIAVLMVIAAVLETRMAHTTTRTAPAITYLVQGLDTSEIAAIEVGKGSGAARLARNKNGQFVISNKEDYPANVKQVNHLISNVLDIKTSELVTSDPCNYPVLEVTEEKASKIIRFIDKNGKLVAGILVGKRNDDDTYYVKLASGNEVYLSPNVPWVASGPMEYIKQDILKVDDKDIAGVTVSGPAGSYALSPSTDPNNPEIVLKEVPAGKKTKGGECKQVFSALDRFAIKDVLTASTAPKDLAFNTTYTCTLKNSTVYTLQLAQKDKETYLKLSAAFTDTKDVVKENRVETEEELKAKEAKLLARESADKINNASAGWIYTIRDYNAKNLMKPLSELVEDIAPPKAAEQPAQGAAAPAQPQAATPAQPQQTAPAKQEAPKEQPKAKSGN